MSSGRQWSSALGCVGAMLVGAGCWFAYRDYGDRQGVTVELRGLVDLQLTTDIEHSASFRLLNNTFRPAKLVSGEPG